MSIVHYPLKNILQEIGYRSGVLKTIQVHDAVKTCMLPFVNSTVNTAIYRIETLFPASLPPIKVTEKLNSHQLTILSDHSNYVIYIQPYFHTSIFGVTHSAIHF